MPRHSPNIVPRHPQIGTATTSAIQTSGGTITYNHTVEDQAHAALFVFTFVNDNAGGSKAITGITYNGVALTQYTTLRFDSGAAVETMLDIWFLRNPTVGTNSVVITSAENFTSGEQGIGIAVTLWNVETKSIATGPIEVAAVADSAGVQVGRIDNVSFGNGSSYSLCLDIVGTNNNPGHVVPAAQTMIANVATGGTNITEMSVSWKRMAVDPGALGQLDVDMDRTWTGNQEAGSLAVVARAMGSV